MAENSADVALVSPADNLIFNNTNNITFECNATTNSTLRKIDLYTSINISANNGGAKHNNINSAFSRANSSCIGELCSDSGTVLLMHFNNDSNAGENGTQVYDWSGSGNNATVSGAVFNASGGKFFGAFEFDGTGNRYMRIPDSDSVDLASSGTIELWINPAEVESADRYILLKAPSDSLCTRSSYALKLLSSYPYQVELDFNGDYYAQNVGDPYTSSGGIGLDTWSHVVYTWNGSYVDVYINGARDSSQGQAASIASNNNPLWIGATDDGSCDPYGSFFSGAIDELAIYNRTLTAEEITEHYNRVLVNSAEKNWTISNVSDGTYTWNCLVYDNESQTSWAVGNYTFSVDLDTPPQVDRITLSPNSSDDIDPGVTIDVASNVTDISGVDTVIFQYKSPSAGSFTNLTMGYNNSTGLYNASFTPLVTGVWKYRFWSNDTLGHAGISNETNLSVEYDITWTASVINISGNASSEFGTVHGFRGSEVGFGIIVINNTGDDTLNFDLLSSSGAVSFQYNISEPFDLGAKSAEHINVTATAPETPYEYSVKINISATSLGATPAKIELNGSLVSYIGGPYFDISIDGYSPSVSQGQTVNMSAKIKNIGNETATGVWLNWTLPSGWENISGDLNTYFGNISVDAQNRSNITVRIVSASAPEGVFTLYANASAGGSVAGFDSKMVSVSCSNSDSVCGSGCSYLTDSDCAAPVTNTHSGGGTTIVQGEKSVVYMNATAPVLPKYNFTLKAPKRIDVYRGNGAKFIVNLSNYGINTSVYSARISLSGYPRVHVRAEPEVISSIIYNSQKQIAVSIDVPNYMKYGIYNLTIIAKGTGVSLDAENSTDLESFSELLFVVHSAAENDTVSAIGMAESLLDTLSKLNISSLRSRSMLDDAKKSLDGWNYDLAKELGENAVEASNAAIKDYGLLLQVKGKIDEAGKYNVDAPQTLKMYSLAKAAFEREDYAKAEQRANDAIVVGSMEIDGKIRTQKLLDSYGYAVLGVSLFALLSAWIIYRRVNVYRIGREMTHLESEEKSLRSLIEEAKKEHFEKRLLSKAEYYHAMDHYEQRLSDIKRHKSRLVFSLIHIANPVNVIAGFKNEEKKIREAMADIQRKYFEQGKTTKEKYSATMHELKAELAEIKMEVESAEEKANNRGSSLRLSAFLIVSVFTGFLFASVFIPETASAVFVSVSGVSFASFASTNATAIEAINNAQNEIDEMQKAGLGTSLANDTLGEARLLLLQGNALGAESVAKNVGEIKKMAIRINALIDAAEAKIYDASSQGIDVSEPKKLFDSGLAAFKNEEYETAEKMINGAINSVEGLEAQSSMESALSGQKSAGVMALLIRERRGILEALILIALASLLLKKQIRASKTKKRIAELELRLNAANRMIQNIQKDYFEKGAMSKSDYNSGMHRYREIILNAKKELSILRNGRMFSKNAAFARFKGNLWETDEKKRNVLKV